MDNYRILNLINLNFFKLFSECKSCVVFTPPLFISSKDIDALIVINQIVDIVSKPENIILNHTLSRIIYIKCREFTELNTKFINSSNFTQSFLTYINKIVEESKVNIIKEEKVDYMII